MFNRFRGIRGFPNKSCGHRVGLLIRHTETLTHVTKLQVTRLQVTRLQVTRLQVTEGAELQVTRLQVTEGAELPPN